MVDKRLTFLLALLLISSTSAIGYGYNNPSLSRLGTAPISDVVNYCSANFVPFTNSAKDIDLNFKNVTNLHLIQFSNLTDLPLCQSSTRGIFGYSQGALGVADQLLVCKKNALDLYVWTPI